MPAAVPAPTDPRHLDEALSRLREGAGPWARAPLPERIELARAMLQGTYRTAARAVAAGLRRPRASAGLAAGGRGVDLRPLRHAAHAAAAVARSRLLRPERQHRRSGAARRDRGRPPRGPGLPGLATGPRCSSWASRGRGPPAGRRGPAALHDSRAPPSTRSPPRREAVPGAGRRQRQRHPAHRRALQALRRGQGLPPQDEPGERLPRARSSRSLRAGHRPRASSRSSTAAATRAPTWCSHPAVDEVHITGSDQTHDLLVWGPPGPGARGARKRATSRCCKKEITCELGNVSPGARRPGPVGRRRRWRFQAENVAGMVTHNASFNCNAAKLLVPPKRLAQREQFLDRGRSRHGAGPGAAGLVPGRARSAGRQLTEGRAELRSGRARARAPLPWTLVPGLDAARAGRRSSASSRSARCSRRPRSARRTRLEFLAQAVDFVNEQVWGTLSATLVVHPRDRRDPSRPRAVEQAIRRPALRQRGRERLGRLGFAFGTTPWGAYPGARSRTSRAGGAGCTTRFMLEDIEKVVIRHPARTFPKPPYYPSHRTAHRLGRALVELEGRGRRAMPAVLAAGMGG